MQGLLARLQSPAHYRGQQLRWAQVLNPAPYLARLLTFLGSLMRGHLTPTLSGILEIQWALGVFWGLLGPK